MILTALTAPRAAPAGKPRLNLLGLLAAFAAAASAGGAAPAVAAAACAGTAEDATLCLINDERRARGRAVLDSHPRLALAARRHSADMVEREFFSHVSPGGSTLADRLRRTGYLGSCAWSAGETLAWGFGDERTPASRVAAWMRSRPHRRVLLNPRYRDAGIGVARGIPEAPDHGLTYTAEFARRRC